MKTIKITFMIVFFSLVLGGCMKNESATTTDTNAKTETKTIKVSSQKVDFYIETTGSIQPDKEGGAKIISPLGGSVEKIFVKVGDAVKKGDALVTLRSSDVSDNYANYLQSVSQLKQAERIYNLDKDLFKVGAVTKNDLLNSEANYEQAQAQVDGLIKKLAIYGLSTTGGMPDRLTIRSPINGYVADLPVHLGDRFDSATPLLTIATPGNIVVVADIYDTDVPKIKKTKEVTFTTDIYPQESFKGVVTYISDMEDPDTKTVKTYIHLLNQNGLFKQNEFLKMRIFEEQKDLPVIPKTAMIYKDGKFYVQMKVDNKFELKEIKPIRDVSDQLMAVEGINPGDEIISSAIDMEST
jgi:membrane fusion protein, heavy metal efflux system